MLQECIVKYGKLLWNEEKGEANNFVYNYETYIYMIATMYKMDIRKGEYWNKQILKTSIFEVTWIEINRDRFYGGHFERRVLISLLKCQDSQQNEAKHLKLKASSPPWIFCRVLR